MHHLALTPYLPIHPTALHAPSGVLPPPPAPVELAELHYVRQLNAQQNPAAAQWTEFLDQHGGYGIWKDFAKQYRQRAGFVRGWMGTGLLHVALGVNALRNMGAKRHYGRLRPFQVDGGIRVIGKVPKDFSYPSGHTSSAYTAATVMSALWPTRAHEFAWWARQVGVSRIHAGVHFPSDVVTGARLGVRNGVTALSLLA